MSASKNKTTRPAATVQEAPAAPQVSGWAAGGRWVGPTVIAAATAAMVYWSWGTWPDVIVDFGRELYVPWQINEGQVLYRDLAYFNGPLSPYVNALWFRIFGVGLRTLVLANLAIFGVLVYLCYSLLLQIGSRTAATLACLVLVFVFGFSRYVIAGNYNYLCPYSHEATHGVTLGLASFYFLTRYSRTRRLADVALCGLCVGLVALTKPEVLVATLPAAIVGLALGYRSSAEPRASISRVAIVFSGALLAPPLVAMAFLSLAMPVATAATGVLGGWKWVMATDITSLPFYQHSMGSQDALKHFGVLLLMFFWYGMVLGIPAGIGLLAWPSRTAELATAAVCFCVVAGMLLVNFEKMPTSDAMRPLPLVMVTMMATAAVLWRRQPDDETRRRLTLTIVLSLFGLLMLAKIILHARLSHYGFYLAMPGTLMAIYALWDWGPRAFEEGGGSGWMLRAAFLAALMVFVLRCLDATREKFATLTVPIGSGADAFWADSRGNEVNRLLAELHSLAAPEATLAVVPEGIMLNYLSRRRDSTPYISLMPVEVLMFGETKMLEAFREAPPDYLIITDEDMADYGFENFKITNDGYADLLGTWFADHYQLVGQVPADDGGLLHGILLEYVQPEAPPAKSTGKQP
jgi:hypothetical protein